MDSRRNSTSTTARQLCLEVPVTPAAAPMRKDAQQQRSQQQRPVEAHQELQHLWHHNPMIETDLVDFWDCVVPGSGGHPTSVASAACHKMSWHDCDGHVSAKFFLSAAFQCHCYHWLRLSVLIAAGF